jgi:predicted nicotinamide N-methyase
LNRKTGRQEEKINDLPNFPPSCEPHSGKLGHHLVDIPPRDPAHAFRAFIEANTSVVAPPLLPELCLHLATEVTPLWHATSRDLSECGIEPPFWAFAWAGGQALARLVLDSPEIVRGRHVLDFASGSGLVAIAAALAGAAKVIAVELDPVAVVAIGLNAERHGVDIEVRLEDVLPSDARRSPRWTEACDVVLAGDVCYDQAMASRVIPWLLERAAEGALVLLGDPGRAYLPSEGLVEIARHRVPIIDDVEAGPEKWGVVYRVIAR